MIGSAFAAIAAAQADALTTMARANVEAMTATEVARRNIDRFRDATAIDGTDLVRVVEDVPLLEAR